MAGIAPEYLVFGRGGQLGNSFKEILADKAIYIGRDEMDLSCPEKIIPFLNKFAPKYLINAAAYTAVDKAEEEEEKANLINSKAVAKMAEFAKARNIPFVHYSTDYVFSGQGEKPWKEDDKTSPLNAYGRSKLKGEESVKKIGGKYLVFRTSWVYDHHGKNFLSSMIRLGENREELSVVNDQFGAPTYAPHLAKYSLKALEKAALMPEFPSGIYHMAGSGITTWHGFAEEIFKNLRDKNVNLKVKNLKGIPAAQYKTPAARPHNSRLDMAKIKKVFGIEMPDWKLGLKECMERL